MRLFQDMHQDEVEDLLEQLTAYALRLMRQARWRGVVGGRALGGQEATDVVHDVIVKYERGLLYPNERGVRRLNRDVDLAGNLMGGVRSAVDALARRKENASEQRLDTDPVGEDLKRTNPERAAIYNELTGIVYNQLLEAVLDDDDLTAAMEVLERKGGYTAGELEEALGLNHKEAKALRRRFSRALDKALTAIGEDESHG